MRTKKEVSKGDVLRYLYHETSGEEKRTIQLALLEDAELQEMFYDFASLKSDLDEAAMSPSDASVQNILNYSKNHKASRKGSSKEVCKVRH